MQNEAQLDKWELALEEQIKILKQCQDSKQLSSCSLCEQFLMCQTRQQYIKAVYESMNKGSGGGFEF